MANIRKQFNFRNGLQVDDDNLVVSPTGLVGIGTTIPTEVLDVRGDVKVVGFVTSNQIFTNNLTSGIATITNLSLNNSIIGSGISIRSGIVTASSTGVVTYYGDGGRLLNLPTSQWLDIDVGLGFTSIYAQGYVGVGTIDPRFLFQISGNTDTTVVGFTSGVGFSSEGNILATGIVTAYKFSGIGSNLTQLNASNIDYGIISNDRIPTLLNSKMPANISVSGIITAQTGFVGSGQSITLLNASNVASGTLSNSVLPSNIIVSGIITASNGFVGNVTGTASTALSLSGTPNITVGLVSASNSISIGGGFIALNTGNVGIGTTNPTSELQIRKASGSLLEVISDSGAATIKVGRIGDNSASLIFGGVSNSFEIYNNDIGNINSIIHNGAISGINTGRFNWIYGQTNENLMSLTYDGKLGIGKTNPEHQLHVQGISTVTGNAWFNSNVTIEGNLNISTLTVTSSLSGDLIGNVYALSGVSTFNDVKPNRILGVSQIGINTTNALTEIDAIDGTLLINSIGIGTTSPNSQIDMRNGTLLVGAIGVGTTSIYTNQVTDFSPEIQSFDNFIGVYNGGVGLYGDISVGLNTDDPRSVLDFGLVGAAATIGGYFIPPTITTANRNQLSNNTGIGNTIEGAIIYNSTTKKHQGYGSLDGGVTFGWQDLY